ncbi:MAG: hypothetical protein U0736_03640 [Gemmataceae bacterium]
MHPLLLAVGSEQHVPYAREHGRRNCSPLPTPFWSGTAVGAKVLLIVALEDAPDLDIRTTLRRFYSLLERTTRRALSDAHDDRHPRLLRHRAERGSKLDRRRRRAERRTLATTLPAALRSPDGFCDPRLCQPGVLAVTITAPLRSADDVHPDLRRFCAGDGPADAWPDYR